jgi:hypothetical protein
MVSGAYAVQVVAANHGARPACLHGESPAPLPMIPLAAPAGW